MRNLSPPSSPLGHDPGRGGHDRPEYALREADHSPGAKVARKHTVDAMRPLRRFGITATARNLVGPPGVEPGTNGL